MLARVCQARKPQQPADDDLADACDQSAEYSYGSLVYPCRESPIFFIKYGAESLGIKEELRNQLFAFEALEKLQPEERKAIRIPEIYRVIERRRRVYIVMEYVEGMTLAEYRNMGNPALEIQGRYEQIAKAIRLFLAFDIPVEAFPGPVGGGLIRHPIFKDAIASLRYESVKHLQEHLTKVANCPNNNSLAIDFTGEKMCFCFSDLFEGNFIFTPTNTLYIIDFHHAAFLPVSFMTHALDQPRPVCAAIKDQFDLPQKNLSAMKVAGNYFGISTRRVGLIDVVGEKLKSRDERREATCTIGVRRVGPEPGPGPGPRIEIG